MPRHGLACFRRQVGPVPAGDYFVHAPAGGGAALSAARGFAEACQLSTFQHPWQWNFRIVDQLGQCPDLGQRGTNDITERRYEPEAVQVTGSVMGKRRVV